MDQTPKPSGTQRRFVITPDQIAKLGLTAKLQSVIATQLKKKPSPKPATPKNSETKKSTPKTSRKSKIATDDLDENVSSGTKAKIREKILAGNKGTPEELEVENKKRGKRGNTNTNKTVESRRRSKKCEQKSDKAEIDESINSEDSKTEINVNVTPQRKVTGTKKRISSVKKDDGINTMKRRGRSSIVKPETIDNSDLEKSTNLIDELNNVQPLTITETSGVIHLPPFSVLKKKSWNVNNAENNVDIPITLNKPAGVNDVQTKLVKTIQLKTIQNIRQKFIDLKQTVRKEDEITEDNLSDNPAKIILSSSIESDSALSRKIILKSDLKVVKPNRLRSLSTETQNPTKSVLNRSCSTDVGDESSKSPSIDTKGKTSKKVIILKQDTLEKYLGVSGAKTLLQTPKTSGLNIEGNAKNHHPISDEEKLVESSITMNESNTINQKDDDKEKASSSKRRASKNWDLRLVKPLITQDNESEGSDDENKSKDEVKNSVDYQDDHNRAFHALVEATTEYFQKNKQLKELMEQTCNLENDDVEHERTENNNVNVSESMGDDIPALTSSKMSSTESIGSPEHNDNDKNIETSSQSRASGVFAQASKLKTLCDPVVVGNLKRRRIPNKPMIVLKRKKVDDSLSASVDAERKIGEDKSFNNINPDESKPNEEGREVEGLKIDENKDEETNYNTSILEANVETIKPIPLNTSTPKASSNTPVIFIASTIPSVKTLTPIPRRKGRLRARFRDWNDVKMSNVSESAEKSESKIDIGDTNIEKTEESEVKSKDESSDKKCLGVEENHENENDNTINKTENEQFLDDPKIIRAKCDVSKLVKDDSEILESNTDVESVAKCITDVESLVEGNTDVKSIAEGNTDIKSIVKDDIDEQSISKGITDVAKDKTNVQSIPKDNVDDETVAKSDTDVKSIAKSDTDQKSIAKSDTGLKSVAKSGTDLKSVTKITRRISRSVKKRNEVPSGHNTKPEEEQKITNKIEEDNTMKIPLEQTIKEDLAAKSNLGSVKTRNKKLQKPTTNKSVDDVGTELPEIQEPSKSKTTENKTEDTENIKKSTEETNENREILDTSPDANISFARIKQHFNGLLKITAADVKPPTEDVDNSKLNSNESESNTSLNKDVTSSKTKKRISRPPKNKKTIIEVEQKHEVSELSKTEDDSLVDNVDIDESVDNKEAIVATDANICVKSVDTSKLSNKSKERDKSKKTANNVNVFDDKPTNLDPAIKTDLDKDSTPSRSDDDGGNQTVRRSARISKKFRPSNKKSETPSVSSLSDASLEDMGDEEYFGTKEDVSTDEETPPAKTKIVKRVRKTKRIRKFRSNRLVVGRKCFNAPRRFRVLKKTEAPPPSQTEELPPKETGGLSIANIKLRLQKALALPSDEPEGKRPFQRVKIHLNKHFVTCTCSKGLKVKRLLYGKKRALEMSEADKNSHHTCDDHKTDEKTMPITEASSSEPKDDAHNTSQANSNEEIVIKEVESKHSVEDPKESITEAFVEDVNSIPKIVTLKKSDILAIIGVAEFSTKIVKLDEKNITTGGMDESVGDLKLKVLEDIVIAKKQESVASNPEIRSSNVTDKDSSPLIKTATITPEISHPEIPSSNVSVEQNVTVDDTKTPIENSLKLRDPTATEISNPEIRSSNVTAEKSRPSNIKDSRPLIQNALKPVDIINPEDSKLPIITTHLETETEKKETPKISTSNPEMMSKNIDVTSEDSRSPKRRNSITSDISNPQLRSLNVEAVQNIITEDSRSLTQKVLKSCDSITAEISNPSNNITTLQNVTALTENSPKLDDPNIRSTNFNTEQNVTTEGSTNFLKLHDSTSTEISNLEIRSSNVTPETSENPRTSTTLEISNEDTKTSISIPEEKSQNTMPKISETAPINPQPRRRIRARFIELPENLEAFEIIQKTKGRNKIRALLELDVKGGKKPNLFQTVHEKTEENLKESYNTSSSKESSDTSIFNDDDEDSEDEDRLIIADVDDSKEESLDIVDVDESIDVKNDLGNKSKEVMNNNNKNIAVSTKNKESITSATNVINIDADEKEDDLRKDAKASITKNNYKPESPCGENPIKSIKTPEIIDQGKLNPETLIKAQVETKNVIKDGKSSMKEDENSIKTLTTEATTNKITLNPDSSKLSLEKMQNEAETNQQTGIEEEILFDGEKKIKHASMQHKESLKNKKEEISSKTALEKAEQDQDIKGKKTSLESEEIDVEEVVRDENVIKGKKTSLESEETEVEEVVRDQDVIKGKKTSLESEETEVEEVVRDQDVIKGTKKSLQSKEIEVEQVTGVKDVKTSLESKEPRVGRDQDIKGMTISLDSKEIEVEEVTKATKTSLQSKECEVEDFGRDQSIKSTRTSNEAEVEEVKRDERIKGTETSPKSKETEIEKVETDQDIIGTKKSLKSKEIDVIGGAKTSLESEETKVGKAVRNLDNKGTKTSLHSNETDLEEVGRDLVIEETNASLESEESRVEKAVRNIDNKKTKTSLHSKETDLEEVGRDLFIEGTNASLESEETKVEKAGRNLDNKGTKTSVHSKEIEAEEVGQDQDIRVAKTSLESKEDKVERDQSVIEIELEEVGQDQDINGTKTSVESEETQVEKAGRDQSNKGTKKSLESKETQVEEVGRDQDIKDTKTSLESKESKVEKVKRDLEGIKGTKTSIKSKEICAAEIEDFKASKTSLKSNEPKEAKVEEVVRDQGVREIEVKEVVEDIKGTKTSSESKEIEVEEIERDQNIKGTQTSLESEYTQVVKVGRNQGIKGTKPSLKSKETKVERVGRDQNIKDKTTPLEPKETAVEDVEQGEDTQSTKTTLDKDSQGTKMTLESKETAVEDVEQGEDTQGTKTSVESKETAVEQDQDIHGTKMPLGFKETEVGEVGKDQGQKTSLKSTEIEVEKVGLEEINTNDVVGVNTDESSTKIPDKHLNEEDNTSSDVDVITSTPVCQVNAAKSRRSRRKSVTKPALDITVHKRLTTKNADINNSNLPIISKDGDADQSFESLSSAKKGKEEKSSHINSSNKNDIDDEEISSAGEDNFNEVGVESSDDDDTLKIKSLKIPTIDDINNTKNMKTIVRRKRITRPKILSNTNKTNDDNTKTLLAKEEEIKPLSNTEDDVEKIRMEGDKLKKDTIDTFEISTTQVKDTIEGKHGLKSSEGVKIRNSSKLIVMLSKMSDTEVEKHLKCSISSTLSRKNDTTENIEDLSKSAIEKSVSQEMETSTLDVDAEKLSLIENSAQKRRGRPKRSLPTEEKPLSTETNDELVESEVTPKRKGRKKKSLEAIPPDYVTPPIGKRKRAAIDYAALNEGSGNIFITPQPVLKKMKTASPSEDVGVTSKRRGRPKKVTTPVINEEAQNEINEETSDEPINEPKKKRKEYLLLLKNAEILVTEASDASPGDDASSTKEETDDKSESTPSAHEECTIPKSRRKGRPRKVILGEENMEISPTLNDYLPKSIDEDSVDSKKRKKRESGEDLTSKKDESSDDQTPKKSYKKARMENSKDENLMDVEANDSNKVENSKDVEANKDNKVENSNDVETNKDSKVESSKDVEANKDSKVEKSNDVEANKDSKVGSSKDVEANKDSKVENPNEGSKVEKKKLGGHIDVKPENETIHELQNRVLVKSLVYVMRDQMALAKANDSNGDARKGCVKCAVCREILKKNEWSAHAQRQHNNLAWTVDQPEMDLNNVAFVINTLARIYTKKKPFFCIKCKDTKKSVIGFLGHVVQCKRTNEELEGYKIECTVCAVKVMPHSYVEHMKCHKIQEEKRKVAAEISKQQPLIVEDCSPAKKRQAAKRASYLIQSVSNDAAETDKWSTKRNYSIKKERIADSEYENYITTEGDSCMCTIAGCNNESKGSEEAQKHFAVCKSSLENKYCCKFCDGIFAVKREFDCHFEKEHADKLTDGSDFEHNGSDSESDSEQRPRRVKTGTADTCKSSIKGDKRMSPTFKHLSGQSYQLKFLYEAVYIKGISLYLNHWCYSKHLEFCDENYKNAFNLFSDVGTKMDLLDRTLIKDYLPKLKKSMFVNSEVSPQGNFTNKYKGDEPFKQYKLFESNLQPSGYDIIFCGGPISSMSWVPTPHTKEDCQQILAISVIPDPDKGYSVAETYNDKSIIQFWNLGVLDINVGIVAAPKLEFCLAHDHGPIWAMEWCPSGCYDDEQLGLVAVTGTDSIVYGYRIPQPKLLSGVMYKADPIFKLILSRVIDFNVAGQSFYATRISWSKASGHRYICVGYTNGVVAVYDLDPSSDLLKTKQGDVLVYHPYLSFQGHNAAVTGVALYYMSGGNKWLATASYDRTVKFWNLDDIGWPLSVKRKCQVKETVWMNNWISTVDAHDDWSNPVLQTTSLSQLREFAAQHCNTVMYSYSSVNSVSASDWGNIIVQGNLAGELIGCYVKHLLPFTVEVPAKRFYMSQTKLLPKKEMNLKNNMERNEFYDYKTTSDNTNLVFVDFELKCYKKVMKSSETTTSHRGAYDQAKMDMYPIQSITNVRVNPNRHSFLYTAVGYQTGFVRLVHSKFLSSRT